MKLWERLLIRWLPKLYPKEFRLEFQDQWAEFIVEQRREERYRSRFLGGLRFWWDVGWDVVVSASRIRREPGQVPKGNGGRTRGPHAMDSLLQDLRFSFRTLRRRPLFTGVAVVTLGLGIGASTAMFSVVDGVLMVDSPYREPDRVMSIWQGLEGRDGYTAAGEIRLMYSQYRELQEQSTAFESVAVYAADWGETTLGGGSRPELVTVGAATATLLPTLGVSPILGRWFAPDEEGKGAGDRAMVAVLDFDTWVGRYGGDPDVLGRDVILNGLNYSIVGVLPPGFRMQWLTASFTGADDPGPRDYWVPIGSPEWGESPGSTMWEAVGRLRAGVTLEVAREETGRILQATWPSQEARAILLPRVEAEVRGIGSPLLLLLGATGLLLLIACGNVAALSLGEMFGRAHEVATRAAIGAGRWRIIRQLLTESVVLGILGSVLGALVAVAGTGALVAMAPPIPRIDLVRVDLAVLLFAAALGTLTGLIFGAAPAWITAREAVGSTLRLGNRGSSRRQAGLGRWVLAGEIGLTVMLLVASGLLLKSLSHLFDVELGFDPRNLASVEVQSPGDRNFDRKAGVTFMREVLLEMEAIPGVTAVSATNALPFPGKTAGWASRVHREDSTYLMPQGFAVAAGYLDFMKIPVLEGRGLLPSDGADAPPVMVVSESLARSLWGDRSPVGQEMIYPVGAVTVVGVAGDVRQSALQNEPPLTFYVPFAQLLRSSLSFVVRTKGPPSDVLPAMREALWSVDPALAITGGGVLETIIGSSAQEERYRTFLMGAFAALATLLAVVGIMGVTARHVSHRTRELGIRKALGAEDATLLGGVIRSAAVTGAVGVGLGLAGAFWLSPLMAAFLFGVDPFDPVTYGGVAALFLVASAAAAYLPARRLLRVDPVTVLKAE
jgi:putative ABC transport system permease protein